MSANKFVFNKIMNALDTSGSGGIDFSKYVTYKGKQPPVIQTPDGFYFKTVPKGFKTDRDMFGGVINYMVRGTIQVIGISETKWQLAEEYFLDAMKKNTEFTETLNDQIDATQELNKVTTTHDVTLRVKRNASFFNI